jgi:site-specific DNA-methyltransferase (adenine-specific)
MDRGGLQFFHSLIWDKRNPGLGQRYRRQHEMIMIAHRAGGRIRWNKDDRLVRNLLSQMPSREREHPNEKPVALIAEIVGAHSNAGDHILDPFMGSGTTGVAALRLGRKFVGIEIEERWFDVACRRIEAEVRQGRLDVDQRPYNAEADAIGSYNEAVKAIGERVKAWEPSPDLFRSQKAL